MKRKKKFDPRNLFLMLFSTLLTLGFLEIVLRIVFASDQSFLVRAHRDYPFNIENPYWKVWHYPNAVCHHKATCFESVYHTNDSGLKGPPIQENAPYRIALLGDSYVEGYGKSNDQIFAHFLDSLTGKDVEILNFGTSGGFGTVNEAALYENFGTHFKPDLVILCYLNYNDVHDNLLAFNNGMIDDNMNLTYDVGSKEEVFASVKSQTAPQPRNPVIKRLYVLQMAYKGWSSLRVFMQSAANMKMDFSRALADVYSTEEPTYLDRGYQAAEVAIRRLKTLAEKDSARLLVVNLPDPFQIDKKWLSAAEFNEGLTLNPTQPNRMVRGICQKAGVSYYDMYPNAIAHIEKNQLKFPYLSHTCDRHPDTEGHRYLANDIYKFLKNNNYLDF